MRNKTIWPLLFILVLWAGNAWGANYTVCASGCDGTVADFEAGNAPFDDLNGDTVTFSEDQTDKLSLRAASYGTSTATLIFTGTTITDDSEACLETNGADKVTMVGGTWVGGNGTTAAIEIEANTVNFVFKDATVQPGTSDRGVRVWYGSTGTIQNCIFNGGTNASANLVHLFVSDATVLASLTITGNTFMDSGGRSLDCSFTGSGYAHDITISGNIFNGGDDQAIRFLPSVIDGGECYAVDINGNTFTDTGRNAVDVTRVTSTSGTSYVRNNILRNIAQTSNNANVNGIRVQGSNGVVIENNDIDNVDSTSGDGNGIIIDKATIVTTVGSDGTICRRNRITGCLEQGGAGISNYQSDNSEIYNNICYGNKIGINYGEDSGSDEQSSGGLVYLNTVYDNTTFGFHVRENALGSTWINNIARGNGTYDLALMAGGTAPTSSYNGYSTIAPDDATYDEWAAGTGDVTADPLFKSATDFHLQLNSPCINAGTDVSITTDFEGNPRGPTFFDIGAYEWQYTAPEQELQVSSNDNTISDKTYGVVVVDEDATGNTFNRINATHWIISEDVTLNDCDLQCIRCSASPTLTLNNCTYRQTVAELEAAGCTVAGSGSFPDVDTLVDKLFRFFGFF